MLDEHEHSMPHDMLPAHVPEGEYRKLARKIREVADQTRLVGARHELLLLATKYERSGDHIDRQIRDCHPIFGSFP